MAAYGGTDGGVNAWGLALVAIAALMPWLVELGGRRSRGIMAVVVRSPRDGGGFLVV